MTKPRRSPTERSRSSRSAPVRLALLALASLSWTSLALNAAPAGAQTPSAAAPAGAQTAPPAPPEPAAPAAQAAAPAGSPPASAQPAAPPGGPGVAAPAPDDVASGPSNRTGFMDPFDYDPRGRRDPFAQPTIDRPVAPGGQHGPILPLQRFDLGELRLTGIIWDVSRPRAMIEAPDKSTHVVGVNAKLGPKNGYIATIREGEIVVIETDEINGKLSSTSTVVKITNGAK